MGVIHTRAAAVLKLMDLYTGGAADTRKIHIHVASGNKVIKKTEGCAVILEEPGMERLEVVIEGPRFLKKKHCVKAHGGKPDSLSLCVAAAEKGVSLWPGDYFSDGDKWI